MACSPSPSLALLFASFLRLGVTSFGGPAMIPYIRKMAVEQRRWLDDLTFSRGVALCQVLPGATAMQMAAYVGLKSRGAWGALSCYVGFALPAFIIMMILSHLYQQSRDLSLVSTLFGSLQVIVVAIVANAAVSFGRSYTLHAKEAAISFFAALMFALGLHPISVILLAAFAGLLAFRSQTYPVDELGTLETPSISGGLLAITIAATIGAILLYLIDQGLFQLAALMFRIDLFAFGGGLASLPLMLHEFVEVRGWLDARTFLDGLALGQVTPGPIVITATFVGYMIYGPFGGLVATVSIFLPSFLFVLGFAPHYDRLLSSQYFNRAVKGILCSFVGLLASTTLHFAQAVPWDPLRALLALGAFLALIRKVEVLWVILAAAALTVMLL